MPLNRKIGKAGKGETSRSSRPCCSSLRFPFRRWKVRGLAQELVFADLELPREGGEADSVGRGERRDSRAAIAVRPTHMMKALTRHFHEIAQEVLIRRR
jgi:hypothetical protein